MRETFARNVKLLRSEMGVTQQELAERTGYTRGYVVAMESGKRNFGVDTIERICSALGADSHVMMTIDPTVGEMLGVDSLRAAASGEDPGAAVDDRGGERPSSRAGAGHRDDVVDDSAGDDSDDPEGD